VRMIVPPIAHRRAIDRAFVVFFREHRAAAFRRAISAFCSYYGVKRPTIEWYEYLDWGKTAGKTFEDGRIHLVHPENWKRGRIYNSERMWIQMVYHEMGHYLFWTDAERKADAFAVRMVRGLRRALERRTRPGAVARAARRAGSTRRRAVSAQRATGSTLRRVAASTPRRRRTRIRIGARAGRRLRRA
jgi:hypothetical protein